MLLVSESLVKSYQQILSLVHRLRELLSHYHTTFVSSGPSSSLPRGSPLPELTTILNTFRTLCMRQGEEEEEKEEVGDDGERVAPEQQRVLRNVHAHDHTLRVLALVQEDAISSSSDSSEPSIAFGAAIAFLRIVRPLSLPVVRISVLLHLRPLLC